MDPGSSVVSTVSQPRPRFVCWEDAVFPRTHTGSATCGSLSLHPGAHVPALSQLPVSQQLSSCSQGPPDKTLPPTRPLPTVPPHRSVPPADPRKNDRPKPPRPPTGRPSYPGAKPNICDGDFNTLAVLRREMFVFKVGRPRGFIFTGTSSVYSVALENQFLFIQAVLSQTSHGQKVQKKHLKT